MTITQSPQTLVTLATIRGTSSHGELKDIFKIKLK